jgi:Flp pilus assembly protein TadG
MKPRIAHSGSGQALVEFALVLPILVLIILGLFDAGRAVINYTTLTNAARVGARVAIVNQSNDSTCTTIKTFKCAAAEQTTGMGIQPASIADVVITGNDCAVVGNCDVTVSLTYPYQAITPVVGSLIGPVTLTASETMRIERVFSNP